MRTLSFISALSLSLAFGCSSKKTNGDDDNPAGGSGFQVGTGGGSNLGGAGNAGDTSLPDDYCGGLLNTVQCGQTRLEADVRTVNMLLVIDLSKSMEKPPLTGAQSKWQQMKVALSSTLKTVAKDIDFGLELFPYSGDASAPGVVGDDSDPVIGCNVPTGDDPNIAIAVDVAAGLDHVNNDILPVLESATPAGGTPTTKALEQAYNYFVTGRGKDLKGSKWVLLATDGAPNCNLGLSCEADTCTQNIDCQCGNGCDTPINCCGGSGFICLDNQAAVSQVAKLQQAGINTFVVGVPGTEKFTSTLNSMAEAGGMPKLNDPNGNSYYAVSAANSLEDLQAAFSEITTQLVKSCDVELKQSPPDPTRVIVAIDCNKVPPVDSNTPEEGGADGFWIDYGPTPAHLRLTGTYCSTIRTQGATNLDVITGCQGIF
jgi:hypothetical protein